MEFGFRYNKQVLGKLPPERLSPGKSAPTPNPNPGKNFWEPVFRGAGGGFGGGGVWGGGGGGAILRGEIFYSPNKHRRRVGSRVVKRLKVKF